MPLILPGNVATATAVTAYSVANSCRFNDGDSAQMTRTLGTPTNADKFTLSMWIKRGTGFGTEMSLFVAATNDSNGDIIFFRNDDKLEWQMYHGSTTGQYKTTREFRDPAAWYHLVFTYDSGNATAGNRMRIYVNGTEETVFTIETDVDQNTDSLINSAIEHSVGQDGASGISPVYFDGYMAEVVLCDGQTYAASDFGEFDEDSPTIWKPKDVSGLTFGDNGFYLDFEDSDNLGDDESGNTLDFTEVNIAAVDQATDTPTNNFCTMNPLKQVDNSGAGSNMVISQGNCQLVQGAPLTYCGSTMAPSTGKWYYEMTMSQAASKNSWFGVRSYDENWGPTNFSEPEGDGNILDGWFFKFGNDGSGGSASSTDGFVHSNNNGTYTHTDIGVTLTNDQIIGINLDLDNGDTYMQINGSDVYSGNTISDLRVDQGFFYSIAFAPEGTATTTGKFNFGGCSPFTISSAVNDGNGYGNFEYAPKSGYLAICSKNLGSDGG